MSSKIKKLKFDHDSARLVQNGTLRKTWRLDNENFSIGDTFIVVDKKDKDNKKSWQLIGEATIQEITQTRFKSLNGKTVGIDEKQDLQQVAQQYYGDEINDETVVSILSFDYEAYEEPKQFTDTDANNTSKTTEVKLFADGGSRGNPGPSAAGYVIMTMNNSVLETDGQYLGITTNNQAEYHALKKGLLHARDLGVRKVHVYLDSLLVVNQIKGIYKVKNKDLWPVHENIKQTIKSFDEFSISHVPRELNKLADAEVNRILDNQQEKVV